MTCFHLGKKGLNDWSVRLWAAGKENRTHQKKLIRFVKKSVSVSYNSSGTDFDAGNEVNKRLLELMRVEEFKKDRNSSKSDKLTSSASAKSDFHSDSVKNPVAAASSSSAGVEKSSFSKAAEKNPPPVFDESEESSVLTPDSEESDSNSDSSSISSDLPSSLSSGDSKSDSERES